jgi:hypothetical protein
MPRNPVPWIPGRSLHRAYLYESIRKNVSSDLSVGQEISRRSKALGALSSLSISSSALTFFFSYSVLCHFLGLSFADVPPCLVLVTLPDSETKLVREG